MRAAVILALAALPPAGAELLEKVFEGNGLRVVSRSRAESVERTETGVRVHLSGEGAEDSGDKAEGDAEEVVAAEKDITQAASGGRL